MRPTYNRFTAYHWYLGSAFWRERREYILKRANGKCEKCGQRPPTEVHHLTYIRVFHELPSDLLAVCRECHAEIHWRQPANDNQIQFSFLEDDEDDFEEDDDE
jgi:5-methylcytosine-specific restriction endonuclease McrA